MSSPICFYANYFIVDDGTGCIKCTWMTSPQTEALDISAGDLVTVCGKLSVYKDVKEIWMTLISKLPTHPPSPPKIYLIR